VVLDSAGRVTDTCAGLDGHRAEERAQLAAAVTDPAALAASGAATTVHAGPDVYRVVAVQLDDGGVILTGIELNGVHSAVKKLCVVEAVVGVCLLGLLTALSLMGSGRKLRPLKDMVETASAISEGDLSRRVEAHGDSTEVAQLRNALNAMLHQIETAFQTRERATAQLHQFVADASHELRTPIASIRGYLQLYEKGILGPDEQKRAFGRVAAEAGRMGHLVDELLVLARLDQQPAGRPTAPVDLAALARDGVHDLAALQPERPMHLQAPVRLEVPGEEAQLRKVVANLLSNVRTHTPAHTPVTVEVRGGGETAVLRVADRGPGMRPEDAARVFDRFFRADPDRARVTGGSGLGMSIVQAVVQAHGGTVRLDTAPGAGLAVEVELPVRPYARGEASVTTVMSGGAPTRTGGPQNPAPRVT
jgi:two-component system OmpR family sensor kinase